EKWVRIINDDDVAAFDTNTTNTSLTVVDGVLVLTDSDGNEVSIPLSEINIPTTLVDNNDGTYTYTNEEGASVTINIPANVINNIEQILGDANVLNELIEILGDTYVGGNVYYEGTDFTYVDQSGATHTINFEDIVQANETVTTLVNNNDGTYTYTNEAGVPVIVDVPADVINNIEQILGDTNVLNELIEVLGDTYVGGNVYYDGDTFTYVDESGDTHVINFEDIVQANETVTTLVDNNDGTYTYTSEDGTVTTVDVPASVVNEFENIVNEGPVTINGETFNTIEEYIENIVETTESVTTLVDNNDGTYTYTNEAGVPVIVDVPANVINNIEQILGDANVLNELI